MVLITRTINERTSLLSNDGFFTLASGENELNWVGMSEVRALFVDLNSYFASVEQDLRPELRGKPVGVVPSMVETTCCIAASVEAKKYGVKTGTMVRDSRWLCPGIILVESRAHKYVQYHNAILDAVNRVLPVSEVLSIDEMVCDLSGSHRDVAVAIELAHRIKQSICTHAGETLRCSIGISTNRMIAKLASDMQKPDGLIVIRKEELPQRMYALALRDFKGIGANMEKRFHRAGVFTVEQMYALERHELRRVWGGVVGERWYYQIRGEIVPEEPIQNRTIGHSHVLEPAMRHEAGARAVLERLLFKAAARLRDKKFFTTRMVVWVKSLRDRSKSLWTQEVKFAPCADTPTFITAFKKAWEKRPEDLAPYTVGVSFYDLTEENHETLPVFEQENKLLKLSRAVDQLNVTLGKHKVYFAGAHTALDSAPMRIAFRSIPELGKEEKL